MKVSLIEPRGFCFGVCRALQMLDAVCPEKPYVLHEIVHNKQVVEEYQKRGVLFVEGLEKIPKGAPIVFSAHGVGSQIEKDAFAHGVVIDTTCPFVKKVHDWVQILEEQNRAIVLIGKPGHAEITGTLGRLRDTKKAFVVSSIDDINALPEFEKVGVATQTTLSVDETQALCLALKVKYKDIIFQSGICRATTERQRAVQKAALENDFILVVGDKKSSNANRLLEVAKQNGATSYLIETLQDLKGLNLTGRVAITAAASAPEEIVQQVYQALIS